MWYVISKTHDICSLQRHTGEVEYQGHRLKIKVIVEAILNLFVLKPRFALEPGAFLVLFVFMLIWSVLTFVFLKTIELMLFVYNRELLFYLTFCIEKN